MRQWKDGGNVGRETHLINIVIVIFRRQMLTHQAEDSVFDEKTASVANIVPQLVGNFEFGARTTAQIYHQLYYVYILS